MAGMRAALLLVVASAALAAAGSAGGGAVFAPAAATTGRDLILFSASRDPSSDAGLSVIAPDGSGLRQLPTGLGLRNWAPNGKQLALVTPNGAGNDISVMTATGSVRKLVTGAPVGEWAWSPDSSKIAFADSASPPSQPISVLDVASSRVTKLPVGSSPLWAPDGRRIAFLEPLSPGASLLSPGDLELWVATVSYTHLTLPTKRIV